LIPDFFSNISAKYYENPTMLSRVVPDGVDMPVICYKELTIYSASQKTPLLELLQDIHSC